MQLSRKALSARKVTTLALVAVLVLSLAIPSVAFGAPKVSAKRGAASVYTAQPVKITGSVSSPKVGKGKTVTVQYKKTTSAVWKSVKVKTNASSKYSYTFSTKTTGNYDFRARYKVKSKTYTSPKVRVQVKKRVPVILASTTSTQDSGLFGSIVPAFEKQYPKYDIQVIAVGSGQAIQLGKDKNADVLLVHSPAAEKTFVKDGYGFNRRAVMHNDFLLVGPTADPGKIGTVGDIADCFKKIYAEGVTFVSRGDASGTHVKELALWKAAGQSNYPSGKSWYLDVKSGMGETLRVAGEKNGYTIVDRATWVTNRPKNLKMVQQGDDILRNPYSVIQVTGAKQPAGAKTFADWIVSKKGQQLIFDFGYAKYKQHLFWPDAD